MSWRMVHGKEIQISDAPTISKSGSLYWNVRDILFKDYPVCDAPAERKKPQSDAGGVSPADSKPTM
jgi:hypothetical protein